MLLVNGQPPVRPHDEIIRATSKQPYAPDIPHFKKMHYFKTAKAINDGEDFLLARKRLEWDKQVTAIATALSNIDALRKKFNKPFEQREAINEDIKSIQADINKLDATDITQFTKLTSGKQRLELERNQLNNRIKNDVLPELEPLKESYNKLESDLFKLFNEIAKEK